MIGKFSFFAFLNLVTVIGMPNFLFHLPQSMSSLEEMADWAMNSFGEFVYFFFCEFLSCIFVCKTYYLAVKASLFAMLLPAACIAEALPRVCTHMHIYAHTEIVHNTHNTHNTQYIQFTLLYTL